MEISESQTGIFGRMERAPRHNLRSWQFTQDTEVSVSWCLPKGTWALGTRLSLKVLANEDTLLRTVIVADTNVSPFARAQHLKCCGHRFCVRDTKMFLSSCSETFCVRDTKMFLILFRNILCPQQMFPSLHAQETS